MGAKIRPKQHRRELLVVLVMTVIGGLIRVWSPAKLGLIHFDEGIYALAGLWPISPKGFWGIDPTVIAYAPGGYPFLVGLGSFVLGVGDLTPILVSILMGALTIPLVAWLSWRTFGPTAGAITATFAAFSGFHIAFSRMALTDVSFLFFFILAIGLGQRFLERPNLLNTIGLGIGVGLAQWFKYHGWLAGAIVALAAVVNAIRGPAERQPKRLARIWGQGACAGLIAFAVFWPWFSFVESHGGYADLLKHHASYMQGFRMWLPNLRTQLDQVATLGRGSNTFGIFTLIVVFLAFLIQGMGWPAAGSGVGYRLACGVIVGLFGAALTDSNSSVPVWWGVGLVSLPLLLMERSAGRLVVWLWWLVLTVLTPLYHPYARLWLPLVACGWLLVGFCFSILAVPPPESRAVAPLSRRRLRWIVGSILLVFGLLVLSIARDRFPIDAIRPFVAPSNSLRIACRQIQADLPMDLTRLRVLGRPPITFYLATAGVSLAPQPDLNTLLKLGSPNDWALVDDALLRQEPDYASAKKRLADGWEIVSEYPTSLNLPTLLDINPGTARGKIEPSMLECPLWLLRPRP